MGYKQAMRMWQTGLAVLVWGMALGMLLWGTGLDVALQQKLHLIVPVWLDKTARAVGEFGLGRNQILACLFLGLGWAFLLVKKDFGTRFALKQIPLWFVGCFHQLGLIACGKFQWSILWENVPLRPRLLLFAVPVFAVAGILNTILKLCIGRPRPKEILWNGANPWQHLPFGDAGFMSFPSGHTATTAAIAVVVAQLLPRHLRPLVWLWIIAVGSSRFLAVTPHYVGDVIAGAALGIATALILLNLMGVRHVR